MFSLGSVALFCLTERSAWPADDPADALIQSAAGLWPNLADDAGPPRLVALVREMLRAEPGRRPSAASLAARLASVGEPAPILFGTGPTATPASADRWRGWGAAAARPRLESPPAGGRHSEPTGSGGVNPDDGRSEEPPNEPPAANEHTWSPGRPEGAAGPVDRPTPRPGAARPPSRRNPVPARVGIAVLAGLLVVVLGLQVGVWWTGWEQSESSAAEAGTTDPAGTGDPAVDANWSDVVIGLDAARGRALDAADPALLADVYLDGASAAATADAAVVTQLADNGLRVVDGVHQVVSVTVDGTAADGTGSTPGTGNDESVRLAVVDTLPAHLIVDAAGRQVGLTSARAEQRRILVLSMTDRELPDQQRRSRLIAASIKVIPPIRRHCRCPYAIATIPKQLPPRGTDCHCPRPNCHCPAYATVPT